MRTCAALLLAVVAAFGAHVAIAQVVVFEDEFVDTSNLMMPGVVQSGAGASLVNDATAPLHGPECLHVDGSMTIYFKDLRVVDGEIEYLWRDTDVDVGGEDADGTLYIRVKDPSLLGLTTGASAAGQTDYWVEQDSDAGFQLKKCDGMGNEISLALVDDTHKITGKGWVWHKIRFIGNRIQVKYWQAGQAEPGTWLIDVVDTTATNGWVGLGCWSGQANFAYIKITRFIMRAEAPLARTPVTLDGVISPGEWDDANSYYFDGSDPTQKPGWTGCSQEGIPDGTPIPPTDWSCTFFVKHDDNYVYVATVVADDAVMSDSGANQWEDDAMEIYFDADNDDTNPKESDPSGFQISYKAEDAGGVGGQGLNQWWWAKATINPGNDGYVIEFRVDKAQTGMVTGGTYGFDLSPDDDDNGGQRDIQIWWNSVGDCGAWDNEIPWGEIYLSPESLATTPSAPTNLVATAGDQSVGLQWDPVADCDGYRIYQSNTSGGPYTQVDSVGSATTDYLVTGLTNGVTYYFVVTAFNAAGESDYSNEASATPQSGVSLRAKRWEKY